jgi:lipopolysaccharide/colanic/teichoic acid biosynthesis glycosyltransferase
MNYDAPSFPPSLIPDCEPGLSGSPQPDGMLRNLFDVRLDGFRQPADLVDPRNDALLVPTPGRGVVYRLVKRACDYVIAATALLLLWPILLLIALLIRLDSSGPVLFRQQRLGLRGRPFWVLKYRTMVVDAEQRLKDLEHLNESDGGVLFKIKRDPRVTRIGLFLRRSSLDELPQLINILRGEMSVVGPRPLQLRDSNYLKELAPQEFARRLEVLPGLTGPWQVSGRSEVGFERMLSLDVDYIDHGSIWTDVRILGKTLMIVLLGKGAY